jgi:hypothetical protein
VAGQRKFQPAAQAVPEQRGDRRLLHRFDHGEHAHALVQELFKGLGIGHPLGDLLQVHPDREVLVALRGENQDPHLRITDRLTHRLLDRVHVVQAHAVPGRVGVGEREHARLQADVKRRRARDGPVKGRWIHRKRPPDGSLAAKRPLRHAVKRHNFVMK